MAHSPSPFDSARRLLISNAERHLSLVKSKPGHARNPAPRGTQFVQRPDHCVGAIRRLGRPVVATVRDQTAELILQLRKHTRENGTAILKLERDRLRASRLPAMRMCQFHP